MHAVALYTVLRYLAFGTCSYDTSPDTMAFMVWWDTDIQYSSEHLRCGTYGHTGPVGGEYTSRIAVDPTRSDGFGRIDGSIYRNQYLSVRACSALHSV